MSVTNLLAGRAATDLFNPGAGYPFRTRIKVNMPLCLSTTSKWRIGGVKEKLHALQISALDGCEQLQVTSPTAKEPHRTLGGPQTRSGHNSVPAGDRTPACKSVTSPCWLSYPSRDDASHWKNNGQNICRRHHFILSANFTGIRNLLQKTLMNESTYCTGIPHTRDVALYKMQLHFRKVTGSSLVHLPH
jgi:hypothetical protein